MEKKELYMGKCLKDLGEHFEIPSTIIGKNSIPQILISLKKLIRKAEEMKVHGDEEQSYILYMKFMNLLSKLQKFPDYKKNKHQISEMLGSNEVITSYMDVLESLSNSLKERYAKKYPPESNHLAESTKMNIDDEKVLKEISANPEVKEVVDCESLFTMMKDDKKLLILDCRPDDDYEQSKIIYKFTVHVPEDSLELGMTAEKIQNRLPNDSKVFWQFRTCRPYIIFVDWSSNRFNRNSPVWHLREILLGWDQELQELEKKPTMLLLEGGYEKWKTLYPMKCHNPQYSPPKAANDDAALIGDVEYPNLEDIQMKDSTLNKSLSSTSIPIVDRSIKPSAATGDPYKSPLELVEEREKIMNKSLQSEKELATLEANYKQVVTDKENNEDSSIQEQNYLFKIWELQAKQVDYKIEEKSIKEQLESSKEQIKDPQIMTKVMIAEQGIKEKEMERLKLFEERERNKKEREEALKLARERKPTFNDHKVPPKTQRKNELILTPKGLPNQVITPSIPSFDRSSKPMQVINRQPFNEEDFAPVYGRVERGLTGLKNLGNSCYMNSIIQCLSNTHKLMQYLLEETYEKHVNRNNKTKGSIVRTLAAVIKMLWSGECKHISSKQLKAVIGEQDHLFYGMDQQDSHEFLVMLIDWLQSDLQTIPVVHTAVELPPSEKAWQEYTKAKESFILRLFYGQIKSTVKCTVCSKESSTYDTFSNLSLELPPNNIDRCHIDECFNMYFHGEMVMGWNCPHCKAPRDAIKKLDISKLPPVLTIYVDFPLTDMNMMPYVARTEKNSGSNLQHIYRLYAVSNHYGSTESGHYTAYCRNYKQSTWYKFDDHTVSPLDRSEVKSSAAYILFYTSLPDNAPQIQNRWR
ncbi:CLUMA_CG011986, isoform B [Clunio marinus]|uniref:Ubiquitin carboxyl-terminal hydrolase n=1 Tax=Clunio marinus TaxID=568069 RepID=A0A1J1IFK2_9DIPT|nr:CLUMA_CG011986, isoform B [Clunio marinus]